MTEYLKEVNLESVLTNLTKDCGYTLVDYNKDRPNHRTIDMNILLDREAFLQFIHTTQFKKWNALEIKTCGCADEKVVNEFVKEVERKGLIAVMRSGFNVYGATFRCIYFYPSNDTDIDSINNYENNICFCARQFHFSKNASKKSLDIVFVINGIPIVSVELKNNFSGQYTKDAMRQFCEDRDQNELMFRLNRRCLMMFAVDNYRAMITTKLNGNKTVFLPFDQGSNGPGVFGGAGNPVPEIGVPTGYLFSETLSKRSLIGILGDFITYRNDGEKSAVIAPRFHQQHCVNYLVNQVYRNGPSGNYLVEHSAGSGKSNTISWLAYKLLALHKNGESIFNSVIICVHRKNLNQQLNETVSTFEYQPGMVAEIKTSADLREAILDGNKVLVTTIQKFGQFTGSFKLFNRNFAVIFDEAHTSTTGRLNKKTKEALGIRELTDSDREVLEADYDSEEEMIKAYEKIKYDGLQDNMSFFAFTATPKNKTLTNFGRKLDDGRYAPHHIYSMRQAIEEGYICDVLEDYHTYRDFYEMIQNLAESNDPYVNAKKAKRVLAKFAASHDHVIAKKAAIIVEYMHEFALKELNGYAKAMLVTDSRLQTLKYKAAILKYAKEKGYFEIKVLSAFSGTISSEDLSDEELEVLNLSEGDISENSCNYDLNGRFIKESHTIDEFDKNFNLLIAADKFQVGFDQPYLTTMFVDKVLVDTDAVQTLSRLNRIIPGIDKHTHVIDFRNEAMSIHNAFETYYGETTVESGYDPNFIYAKRSNVESFHIVTEEDLTKFIESYDPKDPEIQNKICGLIEKARIRAINLQIADEKDGTDIYGDFCRATRSMCNMYGAATVSNNYLDPKFAYLVEFCRFLLKTLPHKNRPMVDIRNMLSLEHYRLVDNGTTAIRLGGDVEPLKAPSGGDAKSRDKYDFLSELVREFNHKWGIDDFNENDKVARFKNFIKASADKMEDAEDYKDWSREAFIKEKYKEIQLATFKMLTSDQEFYANVSKDPEALNKLVSAMLNGVYDEIKSR